MKVFIGPYKSWFGPSQLSALLKFVGVSKDNCEKVGEFLSKTFVGTFLNWYYKKTGERKIKVKIHPYDVWSLDHTLSQIILPCLIELKKHKHGSPLVSDDDVPENIRSTQDTEPREKWDTDKFFHDRWEYVLNEMIFAFQATSDDSWKDQFHKGTPKFTWEEIEGSTLLELKTQPSDYEFDNEGFNLYADRIKNGLRLFGTYYQNLWD